MVLGGEAKENSRRINWLELLVPEHIVYVFQQGCHFAGISLIQKIAHQSAKFFAGGLIGSSCDYTLALLNCR